MLARIIWEGLPGKITTEAPVIAGILTLCITVFIGLPATLGGIELYKWLCPVAPEDNSNG